MRLQAVPASRGVLWVRMGFRAFFARPLAFAALFAAFMFAVFVSALLPYIGALIVLALLPVVSLGFMIATRIAMQGGMPTAAVFIDPLRAPPGQRNALIQLGVIYAVATLAILWLSGLVDNGALEAAMEAAPTAQTAPDAFAARLAAPGLVSGLLLRLGLAGLLSIPFWHAPALVHWERQGCAQSLFSSTLACWRNRGAFAIYSLAWFGVILGLSVFGSLVFSVFGQGPLFALAAVPLSLGVTTVFYVSLYFTFADCFVAAGTDASAEPAAGPG